MADSERQDLTLAWIAAALFARPRLTFGLPIAAAILAVLASFAIRTQYRSHGAFVPEGRSMPAVNPSLLGLASQFGVNLGGQTAQSPQFYAEVLRSRELLEAVLTTQFVVPGSAADSSPLLELLRVRGSTPGRRLENGVKKLNKRLAISVDPRTSIVRLAVEAPDAVLARDVTARFLELLNEFNLRRRQSQARERRRFAESRTAAADTALRAAENRIRGFYVTNRMWENSPTLRFEEARLQREVTLREELQLTLSRELETSRIEEVNDTPVITVIDQPDVPQRKSRPKRRVIAVMAIILGAVAGSAAALLQAVWAEGLRGGHPDYSLMRDALRRLLRRPRIV